MESRYIGVLVTSVFFSFFFFIKGKVILACRVVCCSHQSDHHIRLCILHQSDCCIRVCISQQWCHRIWISCTSHSIWGFFFQWCHGIKGLCTKNDINQKFWAHLISVMIVAFARASSSEVKIYCNMKGLHLILFYYFSTFFPAPFPTTHMPNNWHSITYYENNVQSPIRTYLIIVPHEH